MNTIGLAVLFIGFTTTHQTCLERFPVRVPASGREYFRAFDSIFDAVAEKRGLDPALLKAHAWCETRLDPCAVSSAGARGLMQFMPKTFEHVAEASGATDPFDPVDSTESAGVYIAALVNYWKGDLTAAVASYNAGPGAVSLARRRGFVIPPIEETQGYVRCVLGAYRALSTRRLSAFERFAAMFRRN